MASASNNTAAAEGPEAPVVFPSSIRKPLVLALFLVPLGVAGVAIVADGRNTESVILGSLLAFSGAACAVAFIRALCVRVALVVDLHGIVDSSTVWGAGRVFWEEIDEVSLERRGFAKFIDIYCCETDKAVNRASWRKRVCIGLTKAHGSPSFSIPSYVLSCPIVEVFSEVKSRLDLFRARANNQLLNQPPPLPFSHN
ncbi:MAG: hypothetical protein HY719_11685 [Planctomycetes bacterium]|nr:hypothetical protein [Planctomycetota bacterium]